MHLRHPIPIRPSGRHPLAVSSFPSRCCLLPARGWTRGGLTLGDRPPPPNRLVTCGWVTPQLMSPMQDSIPHPVRPVRLPVAVRAVSTVARTDVEDVSNCARGLSSCHRPIASAISHQPSAISHQPSDISHQPSDISHQP